MHLNPHAGAHLRNFIHAAGGSRRYAWAWVVSYTRCRALAQVLQVAGGTHSHLHEAHCVKNYVHDDVYWRWHLHVVGHRARHI